MTSLRTVRGDMVCTNDGARQRTDLGKSSQPECQRQYFRQQEICASLQQAETGGVPQTSPIELASLPPALRVPLFHLALSFLTAFSPAADPLDSPGSPRRAPWWS
jgi:hypothetical protein